MTYMNALIIVIFLTTAVSYANEVERAPIKASDDPIIIEKRTEIQYKRADDDMERIIDDRREIKNIESTPSSQQYQPIYRKDSQYKLRNEIDIRKLQPRNPDELYSCDKIVDDVFYDDEVCARQIIVMSPCLAAPCPTEEHWSTYPSAEHACSHSDVIDFAPGRCLYDSDE